MIAVSRPSILTYLGAVSPGLFGLYGTTVASPANRLEVVQIKELIMIAFVRLNVMNDSGSRVSAAPL